MCFGGLTPAASCLEENSRGKLLIWSSGLNVNQSLSWLVRCYWLETSVIQVPVALTAAVSSSSVFKPSASAQRGFRWAALSTVSVVFRGPQLPSHLCLYFLTWNKHTALRWPQSLNMELVSAPLFPLWAPSFQLSKLHASSAIQQRRHAIICCYSLLEIASMLISE